MPDLPLDPLQKGRAIAQFNKMRLPDVPGSPSMETAGGNWFREIVGALFGSYDAETNQRHIGEIFILAPKKSSKTTYSAALMMIALLNNRRPMGEFLLVAPTQKITDLAFKQIAGMIKLDPFLAKRFHIQDHIKRITDRTNGATLEIKSFAPNVVTGTRACGVLIDEIHEVTNLEFADRVIGQLRGGLISQPEAFMLNITTQSERMPIGVFEAELAKARAVRDADPRMMNQRLLPILYEFPFSMQRDNSWRDTKNWWMVTPNNGLSVTVQRLIPDWEAAQITGDLEVMRWASQHLNIEIGLGLLSGHWPGAEFWERNGDPDLSFERILEECECVVVGIDGGGLDDLFGLAVLGRRRDDPKQWLLWNRAWVHQSILERRKSEAQRLHNLVAAGDLRIVDSMQDVWIEAADLIERIQEAGILGPIGLDPVGVDLIIEELALRQIDGDEFITAVSQGYKLTGTIKIAEVALSDGRIKHCDQPLMSWCVANAKVEPKGNASVVTKAVSGTAKIDPLMATFNAVHLMSRNPEPVNPPSVYEERGMLTL